MSPASASRPVRAGRVALVGRANVGKSTLLNALVGERLAITSAHPQTTREAVRGILTEGDTQFVFVDTPGLHAAKTKLGAWMNDAARAAVRDADAVVLLVEAPRAGAEVDPRDVSVARDLELARGAVVAVTKIDRLDDKSVLLPFTAALAARLALETVVPVSARQRNGLRPLLDEVRARLPEQPFLHEGDALSDQPVRFFVAELVREQVLKHARQEVPHGVAVVVERFEEGETRVAVDATIHVVREAHKKILVGAKGGMIKSVGSAARARIERLLEQRVDLRLWVRVTPDWLDDGAKLREMGYVKAPRS